eukprot:205946_1
MDSSGDEEGPQLDDFLSSDASQLPSLKKQKKVLNCWGAQESQQRLEDGVMTCRIFSTEPLVQHSLTHEVGEEEEEETFASKVKKAVYGILEPLEYHWHKLGLQLWDEESKYGGPHVVGGAVVGNCVEDEWFVTWVLAEVTKILPIIVQVSDGDGEFLLIEAATGLPDCLSPENGSNRAWILRGDLHVLVPDGDDTGCITWEQGLRAIREGHVAPISGPSQVAFQERMRLYPGKVLHEMKHKVRAILPVRAAAALLSSTQLLSSSIHAYCEEAEEPKWGSARQFGTFGFGLGHCDRRKEWELKGDCFGLVEIRLSIPRHLYAMLISHPGPLWEGKLVETWYGRSGEDDLKGEEILQWNLKSTQIGVRLSLGLELACAASKEFGEYSGAALGRALEIRKYCFKNRAIAIGCMLATSIAQEVQRGVLAATKPSISCLSRTDFPPVELEDEDEGWLIIDPKQLEADLIKQHSVERTAADSSREGDALCSSGSHEGEELEHLHHVSQAFNSFVGDMKSGLEGVEVPRYSAEEGSQPISFDAERFMRILAGDIDASLDDGDGGEFGWADGDGFMAEMEAACARMGATNEENGEEYTQESETVDPACCEFTDGDKVFMEQCVAAMREELDEHEAIGAAHRLRKEASSQLSHAKSVGPLKVGAGDGDSDPEDEAHANIDAAGELDIDLNLVENLVDSFASQNGAPGPASNLLREMGIGVPTYIDSGREQRT